MSAMRVIWRVLVPASLVIVIGSLTVWLADAEPPIEIRSMDVRAVAVPRGGALTVEYHVARYRTCPGIIRRLIVDSQDVVQLVEPQRIAVGPWSGDPALTRVTVSIPVPAGAAPGMARYQATIQYQCNPLHYLLGASIDVRTPVIQFEVLRDLDEPQRPFSGWPQQGDDTMLPTQPLRQISMP